MLNNTPRTWVAGELLTAALLNAQLRDTLTDLQAAWTSYTPTWLATTTNPTLGNGTLTAAYTRFGKTIFFRIKIVMGSTTTYGTGQWQLSLPVAPVTARWLHSGTAFDTSAAGVFSISGDGTASTLALRCDPTTAGNALRAINSTTPFTWATGDELFLSGVYEAA